MAEKKAEKAKPKKTENNRPESAKKQAVENKPKPKEINKKEKTKIEKEEKTKKEEIETKEKKEEETKKENSVKEEKEKKSKKPVSEQKFPFALKIIAIVFVASIIIFSFALLKQPDKIKNETPEPGEKLSEIYLIKPDNCAVCNQGHSLIELLKLNGQSFKIFNVSADSNVGKNIIEEKKIKELPSIIIHRDQTSNLWIKDPEGKNVMLQPILDNLVSKGEIGMEKWNYIIPPGVFDEATYFIELVGEECNSPEPGKKALVDIFADPYDPSSIKMWRDEKEIFAFFKDEVKFNWYFITSQSAIMYNDFNKDVVKLAGAYMQCASKLDKYTQFKYAFYDIYCDQDNDGEAEPAEIDLCAESGSPHYGVPLSIEELDATVEKAKLDSDFMKECVDSFENQFAQNELLAISLVIRQTPTTIVNCKYKSSEEKVGSALCWLEPELKGCNSDNLQVNTDLIIPETQE